MSSPKFVESNGNFRFKQVKTNRQKTRLVSAFYESLKEGKDGYHLKVIVQ